MKKQLFLNIMVILLISMLIVGCDTNDTNNNQVLSPVDLMWEDAPDEAVAILINQPTEDRLLDFHPSQLLVLEESPENFLLLTSDRVEEIVIWEIEFDGEDFVRKNIVFNNSNPGDDYILHLEVNRPEGGPHFQLAFISDEGEVTYYITYDGKDGTPDIEYLF